MKAEGPAGSLRGRDGIMRSIAAIAPVIAMGNACPLFPPRKVIPILASRSGLDPSSRLDPRAVEYVLQTWWVYIGLLDERWLSGWHILHRYPQDAGYDGRCDRIS